MISRQQFICSLSIQKNSNALFVRELHHSVLNKYTGRSKGFFLVIEQSVNILQQFFFTWKCKMRFNAALVNHHLHIAAFIFGKTGKACTESFLHLVSLFPLSDRIDSTYHQ